MLAKIKRSIQQVIMDRILLDLDPIIPDSELDTFYYAQLSLFNSLTDVGLRLNTAIYNTLIRRYPYV